MWLHGDLHAHNMIVTHDGVMAAVVDFGDMTAGDPATDLATAWLTFEASARARFRALLSEVYDDDTWRRARAWAVSMGSLLVANSDDDPVLRSLGHHTVPFGRVAVSAGRFGDQHIA